MRVIDLNFLQVAERVYWASTVVIVAAPILLVLTGMAVARLGHIRYLLQLRRKT